MTGRKRYISKFFLCGNKIFHLVFRLQYIMKMIQPVYKASETIDLQSFLDTLTRLL